MPPAYPPVPFAPVKVTDAAPFGSSTKRPTSWPFASKNDQIPVAGLFSNCCHAPVLWPIAATLFQSSAKSGHQALAPLCAVGLGAVTT